MTSASTPPRLSLAARVARLGRLARKELSESLRDRRTLLTLVLMPLLLYPVLGLALGQFPPGGAALETPVYKLAFQDEPAANNFYQYLHAGEEELVRAGVFLAPPANGTPPSPAPAAALPLPQLMPFGVADVQEPVLAGTVDVGLRPRASGRARLGDWELLYREDSTHGLEAVRYLQRLGEAAEARSIREQLPFRWKPALAVTAIALKPPGVKQPSAFLTMVPLILILMTITGAVYPAIDLTAGERERGTLEILMAAPLPRLSLLLAKYAAVMTVAMLTALVNLGAMALTLTVSGLGPRLLGESGLSPLLLAEVFGLLLLFAAFFSAVLLALTSFARSFKEAQAYLIPLMLLSLLPGTLSLVPGVNLGGVLLLVPLLNTVLLARDILAGNAEPMAAVVVVVSTLAYALGAIAVAARLFGAEAIRTDQGGWFAWLRRPREDLPGAKPEA